MTGWMALFADVPAGRAETAGRFWEAVTATEALPAHGSHGEFVPLAARGEDPYLWVQQVDRSADDAGWHLDLFAGDPGSAAATAVSLGARRVRTGADLVTLTTPAGQPFCLVNGHEPQRHATARQWPGGHCSLLDQVCLDLPSPVYEDEARFWSALTGWERRQADSPEFSLLAEPRNVPLRILLQRLGGADTGPPRAHVDFSCSDVGAEQRRHEALGAIVERVAEHWITLRDPVGLRYCITDRQPAR